MINITNHLVAVYIINVYSCPSINYLVELKLIDQRTRWQEIWRRRRGQQDAGSAEGRWKRPMWKRKAQKIAGRSRVTCGDKRAGATRLKWQSSRVSEKINFHEQRCRFYFDDATDVDCDAAAPRVRSVSSHRLRGAWRSTGPRIEDQTRTVLSQASSRRQWSRHDGQSAILSSPESTHIYLLPMHWHCMALVRGSGPTATDTIGTLYAVINSSNHALPINSSNLGIAALPTWQTLLNGQTLTKNYDIPNGALFRSLRQSSAGVQNPSATRIP